MYTSSPMNTKTTWYSRPSCFHCGYLHWWDDVTWDIDFYLGWRVYCHHDNVFIYCFVCFIFVLCALEKEEAPSLLLHCWRKGCSCFTATGGIIISLVINCRISSWLIEGCVRNNSCSRFRIFSPINFVLPLRAACNYHPFIWCLSRY